MTTRSRLRKAWQDMKGIESFLKFTSRGVLISKTTKPMRASSMDILTHHQTTFIDSDFYSCNLTNVVSILVFVHDLKYLLRHSLNDIHYTHKKHIIRESVFHRSEDDVQNIRSDEISNIWSWFPREIKDDDPTEFLMTSSMLLESL